MVSLWTNPTTGFRTRGPILTNQQGEEFSLFHMDESLFSTSPQHTPTKRHIIDRHLLSTPISKNQRAEPKTITPSSPIDNFKNHIEESHFDDIHTMPLTTTGDQTKLTQNDRPSKTLTKKVSITFTNTPKIHTNQHMFFPKIDRSAQPARLSSTHAKNRHTSQTNSFSTNKDHSLWGAPPDTTLCQSVIWGVDKFNLPSHTQSGLLHWKSDLQIQTWGVLSF